MDNIYASDFETTTRAENLHVWAAGSYKLYGNDDNFIDYNNIDDFMRFALSQDSSHYFHNLKFDGEFILYWLFRNGFSFSENRKQITEKSFTTIIDDMGKFYTIEVYTQKHGKTWQRTKFVDSLKLLPMSAAKIAKDFRFDFQKLEIEYELERAQNHVATAKEREYLLIDCKIISRALEILIDKQIDKLTIGKSALANYQAMMSQKDLEKYFPSIDLATDNYLRKAYKGGYVYLKDGYSGKTLSKGNVYDVNSLYPFVMRTRPMPWGKPIFFDGEYKTNIDYPLYVQRVSCMFEVKENHLPTIQIKRDSRFSGTEYLKSSENEVVEMTMTNIDLALFLEHYDVYNFSYIDGYMFKSCSTLFNQYIDYWIGVKIQAEKDGNNSLRTIAKLMLNNLYGKFATNPRKFSRLPRYDKVNDLVTFELSAEQITKGVYLPVGEFITAYAREYTIRNAQANYNSFVYADTDSLHLIDVAKNINVDKYELGAWKHETEFSKAKFLRAKCYIEFGKEPNSEDEEKLKVTCAGMPSSCHDLVTFDNFKIGAVYATRLKHKRVRGGVILVDEPFAIRKNTLYV